MPLDNYEVIEIDDQELGAVSSSDAVSNFNPDKKESQEKPNTTSEESTIDDVEVDIVEGETSEETETPKEEVKVTSEKKEKTPVKEEVKNKEIAESIDFKAITDVLIEEGIFSDFEEKDSIEYTPENFKELLKEQAISKAKEEYDNLLADFDEETLKFIEYSKNGGDLISLAQTQRQIQDVEEADITDEGVAEEVISANYEAKGKNQKWIKSYIQTLKDKGDEAFKEEAEDSKKELLELNKEEKERQMNSAKQAEEKRTFMITQFNNDIKKTINSDTSLTSGEQKKLESFLTLNKKLKNGTIVNDLQIKLYEVQNDPKKYAELGKFLQDIDKYKQDLEKKATKEVTKKTLNILKSKSSTTQANSYLPETKTVKSKNPFAIQ